MDAGALKLDWVLAAADGRFRHHGAALFRIRSLALKAPAVFGFGAIYFAKQVAPSSKGLALAILIAGVMPALAVAPGLAIATLAASRDRHPSRASLLDGMVLAPGYLVVWLLTTIATWGMGPVGAMRMSLAKYLYVDRSYGVFRSVRESVELTRGTMFEQTKLELVGPLDAVMRYGLLRAGLDGRVRAAIADGLVYDFLIGAYAPPNADDASHMHAPSVAPQSAPPRALPASTWKPTVVPEVVLRAPRAVEGKRLRCPRCVDPLLSVGAMIPIASCVTCGGCWLDAALSRQVVANELEVARIEGALAGIGPSKPRPGLDRGKAIACPACSNALQRTFLPEAQLSVDACAEHGTWFDPGELVRVARGFAKSANDREDLRRLSANPPQQPSAYARGLVELPAAMGQATTEIARATFDQALEGTEAERDAMLGGAFDTAVAIVTSDDERDAAS